MDAHVRCGALLTLALLILAGMGAAVAETGGTSDDAYELARNKLLIQAGEIAIQMRLTDDEQRLEDLMAQYDGTLEQLEEFGVGTTEKTAENTDYYFEKYDQALEKYADQDEQGGALLALQVHLTNLYVILLSFLFMVLEFVIT